MRVLSCVVLLFLLPVAAMAQIAPATPAAATSTQADYKLGAGDGLQITVFGVPDLSGQFAVSGTGVVSLPLIGDVPAAGLTVAQLTQSITDKLKDGYVNDPKVSMEVTTFRPYYILGEVDKAGEYAYSDGLNVLNAVARAGGFSYRAQEKRVYIRHYGESQETEVTLTTDLMVAPGDTIRIAERHW